MKLSILKDLKNHGLTPPISLNPNPIISNKLNEHQYPFKVDINNQPGEAHRKMV